MSKIYIRKKNEHPMVLEYQLGLGPVRQFAAVNLPDGVEKNRGYYVEVDHVFIGVYSSKNGPVFFHDKKEYFLADDGYSAEVQKKKGKHIFSLKYKNKVCVEIKYQPVEDINFDNWSTEETMDFFLWLTNALNTRREKFVQYRTLQE